MYYVYVLRSEKNGQNYTGITNNLEERLKRHNSGWVKATKASRPWTLVYSEQHEIHKDACHRELYIKSQKSRVFVESLISKHRSTQSTVVVHAPVAQVDRAAVS